MAHRCVLRSLVSFKSTSNKKYIGIPPFMTQQLAQGMAVGKEGGKRGKEGRREGGVERRVEAAGVTN